MITKKHKNTRKAVELLAEELGYDISWWDSLPPPLFHLRPDFLIKRKITQKEFNEFRTEFYLLLNYLNLEIQEGKRIIKKPKGRNGS